MNIFKYLYTVLKWNYVLVNLSWVLNKKKLKKRRVENLVLKNISPKEEEIKRTK